MINHPAEAAMALLWSTALASLESRHGLRSVVFSSDLPLLHQEIQVIGFKKPRSLEASSRHSSVTRSRDTF